MPNVVLGMLRVDKNQFGPSTAGRLNDFRLTVLQANAALKALQARAPGVRVLMAPEYFWSGYDQIGQYYKQHGPTMMGRDAKHEIYAGLKRISGMAGSLVLVAGSIFYQKPNGGRTATYNVCPVLRNGSFLLKSYKDFDDGSAGKNSKTADHETKDSNPYFKVDGIRFGLEVCGDHNDQGGGAGGKLKRWNAAAGKAIDVHLLVSDSMAIVPASVCARPGGYVAQCDIGGAAMDIVVYPAGGPYLSRNAIAPVSVTGAQINGGRVICYVLSL